MSKNSKTAPKKAPAAPSAAPETKNTSVQKVIDFKSLMEGMATDTQKGLDPNHQVDLLNLAHDIYGKDPKAAERYGMKQETVDNVNKVVAIGVTVALAREVLFAKNEFATLMNKAELNTMLEICEDLDIHIDQKSLPAPDQEGNIAVPSTAIEVSEETAAKIKEEEAIREEEVETDPTKIENEEQLISALKNVMVTRNNLYEKLRDSINFYQAYLKVQASKAENKEEELKNVNAKSRIELLKEIAKLVGACPLVINGVGRFMHGTTSQTKSPITAFCMLRNSTKNRKSGVYALTDEEVADYVRTLIEWTNDAKVADEKARLESLKANLEILKKDEKKNAKGIVDTNEKIEIAEKNLKHFEEVISYVLNPSSEIPASLIAGLEERDKFAVATAKAITDSYYDEYNVKEMKQDGVRHNIEQYAGIIINLFRDPSARMEQYSVSNIMPLEPIGNVDEQGKKEDKPAEAPAEKEEKSANESKKA